jgi:hypothetical protein
MKFLSPQSSPQHTQTPRIATLNVTQTNIEHRAKQNKKHHTETKTAPETPCRTPSAEPQKNFSALILTLITQHQTSPNQAKTISAYSMRVMWGCRP